MPPNVGNDEMYVLGRPIYAMDCHFTFVHDSIGSKNAIFCSAVEVYSIVYIVVIAKELNSVYDSHDSTRPTFTCEHNTLV